MNNIALLILRIVFAWSMLYGHGLSKLNKLIQGDFSFSNPIGIGEGPTLFLAVFSEFLAPIFIIIGYKTNQEIKKGNLIKKKWLDNYEL